MPVLANDVWSLIHGRPQIDPDDLAAAVALQSFDDTNDYRTRLLLRDSMDALNKYWGQGRYTRWLAECRARDRLEAIAKEEFERPGFTLICRRLMEKTRPAAMESLLRELGGRVHHPDRNLLSQAHQNWYIVSGEEFPHS